MSDDLKFLIEEEVLFGTRIKVVGVGGGGSNAVARMMQDGLTGPEFYVLNTDKQALSNSPVTNKLAIGTKLTSGLGAGADPSVGRSNIHRMPSRSWKARTWCLSRRASAAAPEQAPLRL